MSHLARLQSSYVANRALRGELAARRPLRISTVQPTVTLSAANAATSIASSTLRAPKAGAGSAVDTAGDPSFLWLGTPSVSFGTGGNANNVAAPTLTGSNNFATWAPAVAFDFYGDKFELVFATRSASFDYRLRIDGEMVTENGTRLSGLTVSAVYRLLVDFGSVGHREVQLDLNGTGFMGVAAAPAHTVSRAGHLGDVPTVVLGDSITAGQNGGGGSAGFLRIDSWANTAAQLLGWRDVRNAAIAGTGYATAAGDTAFTGRLADLATQGARYVVFGGYNDRAVVGTTLPAAIDTVFAQIKAQNPAEFIVIGCHAPNAAAWSDTASQQVSALLSAKAAAAGALFVDPMTLRPFTGSGNVSTPNGSGNSDLFIQSDNIHPTRAGSQYLGRVLAEAIAVSYARLGA